jgi:hypothetical protein
VPLIFYGIGKYRKYFHAYTTENRIRVITEGDFLASLKHVLAVKERFFPFFT